VCDALLRGGRPRASLRQARRPGMEQRPHVHMHELKNGEHVSFCNHTIWTSSRDPGEVAKNGRTSTDDRRWREALDHAMPL